MESAALVAGGALWFFLPAIIANMSPGFARKLRLPLARVPVSERLLGPGKTWGAYYAGPLGALIVIGIEQCFPATNARIGLFDYYDGSELACAVIALGLGPILGDHAKSYIKRRRGRPPGSKWWPWDQLDFVLASLFLSFLFVERIRWTHALVIIGAILLGHRFVNWAGYRLGLREVPW